MTAPELTRDGRLPAARPNVCRTIDCHNSVRYLVINLAEMKELWVCWRCDEELCARPNWQRVAER